MKKPTSFSVSRIFMGSLLGVAVIVLGFMGNMIHAQGIQECALDADAYMAIAEANIEVAKKLQVEQNPRAARESLTIMRNLISGYCNVNEEDAKRLLLTREGAFTEIEEHIIKLGSAYISAIQNGDLSRANTLMESITALKNNNETVIKNRDTLTEEVVREKITAAKREATFAPLRGSGLCFNDTMFKRLFTIIESINDTRRISMLIASIETLIVDASLTNALEVARAIALNQQAILTVDVGLPTWLTPGFNNLNTLNYCKSISPEASVSFAVNGVVLATENSDGIWLTTTAVSLQDRTTHTIKVLIEADEVFIAPIEFTVETGSTYKIGYDPTNPQSLIIQLYEEPAILGCMDEVATNYDKNATQDDGSCAYEEPAILGCMDSAASNYNRNATEDDGSCEYPAILGCMDPEATNYNRNATEDDRSCTYGGGGR